MLVVGSKIFATCYHVCLENGNSYIMYTDPNNPALTTCQLVSTGCEGGPRIHECPALVGPVDDGATQTMLLLDITKFRPSTPDEHKSFVALLKTNPTVTYPDLKKLPKETVEWMRQH